MADISTNVTKSGLTEPKKQLVETMQRLNFGCIEDLAIRDGEPIFHPEVKIIQDIKLGGENGPRPELQHSDFELKSQVVELFARLKEIGNGSIQALEVKAGLPFRLILEQPNR